MSNTRNRMEQVKAEYKIPTCISVLFVLRKYANDTRSHRKFEKCLRRNIGKPVDKNYAKEIELPTPTERVLTTQSYIEELIEHKNETLKREKHIDARILKTCNFQKFKMTKQNKVEYKRIIVEICNFI